MAVKETPEVKIEDLPTEEPKVEAEDKAPAKPKYNPEELLTIFDSILFEGEYKEDILIKGKLKVTFRSRSASETSEITKVIDDRQFNLISSLQEYRAFLNLTYSLVSFNGKNFASVPIEERKKLVGNLPAVVVATLSDALYTFDAKTDAACREGEANF